MRVQHKGGEVRRERSRERVRQIRETWRETERESERTKAPQIWFGTYIVFNVKLSCRINKQFDYICVAMAGSIMQSCSTIL